MECGSHAKQEMKSTKNAPGRKHFFGMIYETKICRTFRIRAPSPPGKTSFRRIGRTCPVPERLRMTVSRKEVNGMDLRHEWKHEISDCDRLVLRQRLSAVMQLDPHAIDGKYFIRSLYFDNGPSVHGLPEPRLHHYPCRRRTGSSGGQVGCVPAGHHPGPCSASRTAGRCVFQICCLQNL